MGDNWDSSQSAQVKVEFLKTSIFSPSKADTSPKQQKFSKIYCIFTLFWLKSMKI